MRTGLSMPFTHHGSVANRSRIASSEGASTMCMVSRSPSSGPPRIRKPSSTRSSMNFACSCQPSCSRMSRLQSQGPPRSSRRTKSSTLAFADDCLSGLEILLLDEDLSRAAHRAASADAPGADVRRPLHRFDALELQERLDLVGFDLVQHECQPYELHPVVLSGR